MTQTVANALDEKGGRLELRMLDGAARLHIEESKLAFQGYLKSILVSDGMSPLLSATPPSRVSQFEFVDRWDINAWAILAEERPLVLFNAGIPFSLFELFNSLLSRNEILGDLFGSTERSLPAFAPPKPDYSYVKSGSWPDTIPLSPEQAEALTRDGSELGPDARYMVGWSHYVHPTPQASSRHVFALQAYMTALHFLFCHELGHIDRGHLELRRRHTNSFGLHEVSCAQPRSLATVAFDATVLQALESDADMYALVHAMRMYLPKAISGPYEPSLGGRKPGDPQCYRLFFFSVGVLFLFLEYQQTLKSRSFNPFKLLFRPASTHPNSLVRIRVLLLYAEAMLLEAGLVPEAIHGMSIQVLDELVKVGALFGLSSRLLMAPRSEIESALSLLRARLAEINSELEDCATATRERYYRDGKQVTYAEGRKDAEDLRILRGQAVIIYVDGNGIEIPFLEEDSPLAAFLENSEKWEEVAYIDNAVLYALLATSKYPHSESARTRLTAILAKLGRHAAVFDELLRKHGPTSNLADRLNETIDVAGIQTDPERTLEVLEAAVALRPRDVTSRLRLADCKSLLRQFADAEGEYRHALTQSTFDKERIHALVGLGNCAADSERTNDAVEWFQQALAIDGTNAYALMNLGIALIRGGRPQEAVPHLEHALEASPSLASLWYYCSAAYYACGQLDKARERVKKAIELAPEVQLYREALAQLDRFQP